MAQEHRPLELCCAGNFTEKTGPMKSVTVVGIVLILIGVIALALQGITLITSEKVAQVGPLEVTKEKKKTIPCLPF